LIIIFFPQEGCGNKYSQGLNFLKTMFGERKFQMIWIHSFQEKEMEGGERRSQLDSQWKVLLLGGHWKVPLLGGQWKEKGQHLFTFSHFPSTTFT
jgi:hypothetical protein